MQCQLGYRVYNCNIQKIPTQLDFMIQVNIMTSRQKLGTILENKLCSQLKPYRKCPEKNVKTLSSDSIFFKEIHFQIGRFTNLLREQVKRQSIGLS